eukprot:scaffold21761_cov31-Tisochrysis_lutea.AAC.1
MHVWISYVASRISGSEPLLPNMLAQFFTSAVRSASLAKRGTVTSDSRFIPRCSISTRAPSPHDRAGPKSSTRSATSITLSAANFLSTVAKYEPPGEKMPKTRGLPAKTVVDEAAVAINRASGTLCTALAARLLCPDPKGPRKRRTPLRVVSECDELDAVELTIDDDPPVHVVHEADEQLPRFQHRATAGGLRGAAIDLERDTDLDCRKVAERVGGEDERGYTRGVVCLLADELERRGAPPGQAEGEGEGEPGAGHHGAEGGGHKESELGGGERPGTGRLREENVERQKRCESNRRR